MFRTIFAGVLVATMAVGVPSSAEAGYRSFVTGRRVVRGYQRDVRQFQRQSTRSLNQINRGFNRSFRQVPRVRGFSPRSSGVFIGGPRGGVYFRF